MIERITIKNIATFDNTGIVIDNLKKINFIYGTNGSGKTTISNFIGAVDDKQFSNCSIKWGNEIPLKVLTYNKNFREQNFGKGKIAGVFTLGSATRAELDNIENLKSELEKIKQEGIQKKITIEVQTTQKTNLDNQFQDDSWKNIYKNNEQLFKEAFRGYIGSKKSFAEKIIQEHHSNNRGLKTIDELKEKAKIIFGEAPQQMSKIPTLEDSLLTKIESNTIWAKKIIGKEDVGISKLILRLNANDWVNQGRQFIESGSEVCPFCQQKTVSEDFKTQLEEYFDETFVADTKLIKDLSEEYSIATYNLLNILQGIENEQLTNKNTKLNIQLFSAYLKTLNQQFIANKELLNSKIKEPSRSVTIESVAAQLELIKSLIDNANTEIEKHNVIVANFNTERTNLVADVWKFLAEENKTTIAEYVKKIDGLQKGIEKLEEEKNQLQTDYRDTDTKLKAANKNVTSVQPSVDAINKLLSNFGFDNFKIVPSRTENNHYQIEREDGTIAEKTLSEGEVTFITFLYFLQLAKGGLSQEAVSEDRILVIDDPISSLDSSVLFVVSSLLKEMIKSTKKGEGNIKQIIILTHNVYFHKEVSYIDGRTTKNKDVNYWILRKKTNISYIQHYAQDNPIRGAYELLWDELKQADKLSGITIQNTMRRILEAYFKTMGKYKDDDLLKKFENQNEKDVCRSLLCWINDGSHCIPDDLFVEVTDNVVIKYKTVFQKIFNNMGHIEHYNMMMNITTDEQA